ncbi:hypothetical protein ITJ55_07330 [Frigoribacterium sp. VKM Ac-1396]|uniref:hypothetical protein n=1 Tax=Frigoribacterium sp. VKM Ac-1396 TaxID=2783821 RepID=UPI00188BAC17|nr:hypothetical protein [Frigoribacterium sp. VKM Ac-1396]MBF4600618.1 hypothetical protein [Frigoribacterium sp. VKM Ac-1396]
MSRHDALEVHVEIGGATVLAGRAQFHRNRGSLSATTFQYDPTRGCDRRPSPVRTASGDGAAALALLGESCRLTGADVRSELRTTVDALGRWRDVARRNGVRAAETARFADTFEAGLGALRDAVG